jgi:hypothetical protein
MILFNGTAVAEPLTIEAGRIDLSETGDGPGLRDAFQQVNFSRAFSEAPVVTMLPTNEGSPPSTIRIRNVTTTGFEATQLEPSNLDGEHAAMTDVSYIAVEPGRDELVPNVFIEAGTLTTDVNVRGETGFPRPAVSPAPVSSIPSTSPRPFWG